MDSSAAEKPNIVYIVLDQWRGDCLGVADSAHPVMTPHFDQIAYEGIWYRRAYADCPICMPQRATMLTGFSASQHGMPYNNMSGPRSPIVMEQSLPFRLTREAGYQTKAVGKMHFWPERARFGFEDISLHPNDYVNFLEEQGYGGAYRGHGLGGNEVYPAVSAVPERLTHTHWIVDEGIRFLGRRDPDCPFMLWLVFEAPHSPFDPPAPYDRMYDDFVIPEAVIGDWVGTDDEPPSLTADRIARNADRISPQVLKRARRHYYGQITHIDYQLGRLFGELKRRGLYDNTVIVITSDHGEHLGDHRLFAKVSFLESSARVPIILRLPRAHDRKTPLGPLDASGGRLYNRRVNSPALTADIVPTLLQLAGLQPAAEMDGVSLLQLPDERVVCGETQQSVFVTDGRYKFIHYFANGVEQLFDLSTDSDDLFNLAAVDACADVKATLKSRLVAYLTERARPAAVDGELLTEPSSLDVDELRARNTAAWRGPLRYGDGY
ncbi:MAG: sulfatase-like hydrolase/transferase [Chloroflexota bacterium]|nr:sulfatase-like hydrolase/transferase [Chloroflexota bacterium]